MKAFRFKAILFFLVIIQSIYSMKAQEVLGFDNIYPIYAWKIFHVWPTKFGENGFAFIHELDGKVFDPPVDFYDIKNQFPSTDLYSFSKKLNKAKALREGKEYEYVVGLLTESLRRDYDVVRWELRSIKYNYIDYYKSRATIEEESLGIYESGAKKL